MGYFIERDRFTGKIVREGDTTMCGHCQFTMEMHPQMQNQVLVKPIPCGGCKKPLCSQCRGDLAKGGKCDEFERKLERAEARGRFLKAAGLG